jgi:hypothetical protein
VRWDLVVVGGGVVLVPGKLGCSIAPFSVVHVLRHECQSVSAGLCTSKVYLQVVFLGSLL